MAPPVDCGDADRAVRACRLAEQAGQVLHDLPRHLHPGWIDAVGADPALLAAGGPGLLNTALLARFDLRWPDLSAAQHALEIAWLLPPGQLARLCAARALFAVRGALARSVDAGARRRARALVGDSSFEALMAVPQARRDAAAPAAALPGDDAPAVQARGWTLLDQALRWRDARSRRLIELMLPPPPSPVRPPASTPVAAPEHAYAAEHAAFAAALHTLFPEHAWLFGSEPATLTSA
ncbi:type III secretion protein HrpB4 [Rubrivivax sp. RP6-9]|uniref:type III secretion protein HrpB4 n=1 Tax=Rubrivivax sp. RP6-9 TaxID=3415750 RepID=UPI003CC656F4